MRVLSGSKLLNVAPCIKVINTLSKPTSESFVLLPSYFALYSTLVISSHFHVAIMSGMEDWIPLAGTRVLYLPNVLKMGPSCSGHLRREGPMKLKKLEMRAGGA